MAFAVSSFVEVFAIADMVGASFTAATARVKVLVAVKVPSLTVKVKFADPLRSAAGVTVPVQFGAVPLQTTFAFGIKVVLLEDMLKYVELQARVVSTSLIVKVMAFATSSFVEVLAIVEIVGASFTAVTVNVKVLVAVRAPSLTTKLMLAEPF